MEQSSPVSVLSCLLRERRSVRQFRHEPVDPALIEAALDDVRFAPAPTNRQCFRFLAVNDPLVLQAMRLDVVARVEQVAQRLDEVAAEEFRRYSTWFTFFDRAPVVLFGLYRVFVSRLPDGESNLPEGLAEIGAFGGAVHALLLALHVRGLGACWMSGPLLAEEKLLALLRLEKPWRIGAVLPVGWPQGAAACPKKPELAQMLGWHRAG